MSSTDKTHAVSPEATEGVVHPTEESAVETDPAIADEGAAADNAADASASSSGAQAGSSTNTVITITKTVTTSTTYSDEGGQGEGEVKSTSTSQEFEPTETTDDDFIQDLVSMGWTARGRPTGASATVKKPPRG